MLGEEAQMINKHRNAGLLVFSFSLVLAGILCPTPLLAQDVVVSLASPSDAPQGTVNLNVRVIGKGFKKGAVAKWLVTGSETDLGGVTVNSTTYISATDLIANITVASDAQTVKKFDIKVTLTSGRTGKGIERFTVIYNPPDPAIAFVTGGTSGQPKTNRLMVMNADGTNQQTLLQAPTDQLVQQYSPPNWSPDGSQLVFPSKIQGAGIYIINKDGSGLRKVITTNDWIFNDPVWSPAPAVDGNWKIAFTDTVQGWHDIFVVNLDGSGLLNLTNTTDRDEFYPTWDPTATRLASQSFPVTGVMASLYEYDLGLVSGVVGITNTTNLTAMGPLQNADIFTPDWGKSTNRDQIVVTARLKIDPNNSALWIVNLSDPANPVELMATYGIQPLRPSWSPDDSKIVFARGGGFAPIAIINADGTGLTTLDVTGALPDWRRCCPTCATVCAP